MSKFQLKLRRDTIIISKTIENNRKTIEQYVCSNFLNNFITLIGKRYQTASLVQISVQTMEKYSYYKQNNREQ